MKLRAVILALFLAPLAACSSKIVRLTVHSVPEGAAIIQNGGVLGTTPVVVEYDPADHFKTGQCFNGATLTARWVSGATSAVTPDMCPSSGYDQQFTFLRPADAAGADVDARIAAANQMARATRAAAETAADAATEAANWNMIGAALGNAAATYNQPPPPPRYSTPNAPVFQKPVTCTTSEIFGKLQTVCQ